MKFRIAAAKIVRRQSGGAFSSHGSGEQTGGHGSIVDHADSLLVTVRKSLSFNLPADDGVGRLQRGNGRNFFGVPDLGRIEIGHADPADLAFGFQRGESLPGLFDAGFAFIRGPVHLIEIDGVNLQAAETVFALAPNGAGAELLPNSSLFVPDQNAFGEDVGARAAPFLQRASNDLFGVAQAVDGGGVDPVDAQLQRAMNRGDGIGVVLRAPSKFPAAAAESPGAKTDRRNLEIGVSQFSRFHSNPLGETREANFHRGESDYFVFFGWMILARTKLEKKVKRWSEDEVAGSRSVGDKCSVQRDGFSVGIGEEDLLGAGRENGSYDEKRVRILECDIGELSVDGESGAALEAAAANRESGATGCGNSGRRDAADSQGNSGRSEERRVGKECRSRWSPYH